MTGRKVASIHKMMHEIQIPLLEPLTVYDSDREVIHKFVSGLLGKMYEEESATEIENRLYDVLLIADGGLDEEEMAERYDNLQTLHVVDRCITLLAGLDATDFMLQDKERHPVSMQEVQIARNFFNIQLQTLVQANPRIVNKVRQHARVTPHQSQSGNKREKAVFRGREGREVR